MKFSNFYPLCEIGPFHLEFDILLSNDDSECDILHDPILATAEYHRRYGHSRPAFRSNRGKARIRLKKRKELQKLRAMTMDYSSSDGESESESEASSVQLLAKKRKRFRSP